MPIMLPASEKPYSIKRYTVSDSEWTHVVAPWDCDYFSVRNTHSANMLYRTEPDDPNSEDVLTPGAQDGVTVTARRASLTGVNKYVRFFKDMVIVSLKSTSGTGVVVAKFVR